MRRAVVLSTARWRIDFPGRTHSLDPMSSPPPLVLSKPERAALLRWLQLPSTSPAIALRCRIVLACAQGPANAVVARELGVSARVVGRWRGRFLEGRLPALRDRPRSGAPRSITEQQVRLVQQATFTEPPPNGRRWTKRDMAARTGISASSVTRIWRRLRILPGESGGDPDRATPWSALYVAPPESIMVLAVRGADGPEDARGTGSPAARNYDAVLRKQLAATLSQRCTALGDLRGFLRNLEPRLFGDHEVHLICHGSPTRRLEAIRRWQERHASLHVHFPPTKEFWLQLVERHFTALPPDCRAPGDTPLSVLARAVRKCSAQRSMELTWFHP